MPEDVRGAAKDHPEPAKWKQMIAHFLLSVFLLSMLGGIIWLGIDRIQNGYGFWKLTLRFIVLLYVMKVFDILVQDQWLVITLGYFKKSFLRLQTAKDGRIAGSIIKIRLSEL